MTFKFFTSSIIFLATILASTWTWADGVHIKGKITQLEVVKRSNVIFMATVTGAKHAYSHRRAYGRDNKYISAYRAKVTVGKILRGKNKLQEVLKNTKTLWIRESSNFMPGKWLLVTDHYASGYSLQGAKIGDKIVVYLESQYSITTKDTAHEAHVRYLDRASELKNIIKLIPAAIREQRIEWRKGAICKKPNTWYHGGKCLSLKRIKKIFACPKGSAAQIKTVDDTPYFTCKNKRGIFMGPYLQWFKNGRLYTTYHYKTGLIHGLMKIWHRSGSRSGHIRFDMGKQHGEATNWHNNGKVSSRCTWVRGKRHGRCTRFSASGDTVDVSCHSAGKLLWSITKPPFGKNKKCLGR
ncbi:hypothetical protein KKF84_00625 [Myxococcota bacterium]|nr:hypothetical protein [Myxococcota bacterium]MBU1533789.1 hypothetical protein [Myxococcota bacterium]